MKLYDKKFIKFKLKRKFIPGITTEFKIEYNNRSTLKNITQFRFYTDGKYIPNLYETGGKIDFNRKLLINAYITYQPGVKYIDMPYQLIKLNSKYPVFYLMYEKAFGIAGNYVSYDLITGGIRGNVPAGILGTSYFNIKAGGFLTMKNVDIIDDMCFGGNQMYFLAGDKFQNSFHLLSYYTGSGFNNFLTLKMYHKFRGLLVDKIPLIKRLKIEEVLSFNLLKIENRDCYYEIGVGFNKIFGILDLRYSWAFKADKYFDRGITFTYSLPVEFKRE